MGITVKGQRKCYRNMEEGERNSSLGILEDFVKDLDFEGGSLVMGKSSVSLKRKKRFF